MIFELDPQKIVFYKITGDPNKVFFAETSIDEIETKTIAELIEEAAQDILNIPDSTMRGLNEALGDISRHIEHHINQWIKSGIFPEELKGDPTVTAILNKEGSILEVTKLFRAAFTDYRSQLIKAIEDRAKELGTFPKQDLSEKAVSNINANSSQPTQKPANKPHELYSLYNKMVQKIPDVIDRGETTLIDIGAYRKDRVLVSLETLIKSNDNLVIANNQNAAFTPSHNAIHNIICSYFLDDKQPGDTETHFISIEEIARFYLGKEPSDNLTTTQIAEIESYIKDLESLHINADVTEAVKKYHYDMDISKATFSGSILERTSKTLKVKKKLGGTTTYYQFLRPILLDYAAATKQLEAIPPEIFRIKNIADTTEKKSTIGGSSNFQKIKHFLINKVLLFKRGTRTGTIKAAEVYELVAASDPRQQSRARADVINILNSLKFDGVLDSFSEVKKARGKIDSYYIETAEPLKKEAYKEDNQAERKAKSPKAKK